MKTSLKSRLLRFAFERLILIVFVMLPVMGSLHAQAPVSYQSFNYPNHFIRFINGSGMISTVGASQEMSEASFVAYENPLLVGTIFIKPVDYLSYYIRIIGDQLVISAPDGSGGFYNECAFYVRPGLAGQGFSFESALRPGSYIRHSNFRLYVHQNDGTYLYKSDATFLWGGPLAQVDQITIQAHVNVVNKLNPMGASIPAPIVPDDSEEQRRLRQQVAELEQQRLAAEQRNNDLERQRLATEQQRQRDLEEQRRRPPEWEYSVGIDCMGYSTLSNTQTKDVITVSFFDSQGRIVGTKSSVLNDCSFDRYFAATGTSISAVEISTSGNDAFWMDRVWLNGEGREIAKWGKNEGDGYCLSTDLADANGGLKDFIGSRGCRPCLRFEAGSGRVTDCLNR